MVGMVRLLVVLSLALLIVPNAQAKPRSLTVSERIQFYKISGQNAAEFAASMSRNGPYSRQHRRRAWATASRDMTYQLIRQRSSKGCRVRNARVKLKITYKLPKVSSFRGVSKSNQRKWRRMYNLLHKHEKVHGRYYREFASKVQKALRRLGRANSCRTLDRKAVALVKRLSKADSARNDRFDRRDKGNYRRMERIYSGS